MYLHHLGLALRHLLGTLHMELVQIKCRLLRRRENRNSFLSEQRTNNLNRHMTPSLGIEPGPHRWEAGALTTAESLF